MRLASSRDVLELGWSKHARRVRDRAGPPRFLMRLQLKWETLE
jgi:hypothetical protein